MFRRLIARVLVPVAVATVALVVAPTVAQANASYSYNPIPVHNNAQGGWRATASSSSVNTYGSVTSNQTAYCTNCYRFARGLHRSGGYDTSWPTGCCSDAHLYASDYVETWHERKAKFNGQCWVDGMKIGASGLILSQWHQLVAC
jgi:hypothetical protein